MNRPKVNFKPEAWIKIEELREHPKNPRIDLSKTTDQFEKLKASIEEGVFEPIKVSKLSGFCIAGNQRLRAYRELGYTEIPVQYNEYATEKEEIRDMIKDNNEWGAYDYLKLRENLANFDLSLDSLGLNDIDLKSMDRISLKPEKEAIEDDVPELPLKTAIKPGDIFKLGEHRVMCGDSTKSEDVQKLMGGLRADLVFTDPPYNVNYSGRGKKTSNKIENDNMSRQNFRAFLCDAFKCYKEAVKISAPFYVCHSSSSQRDFEDALESVGLHIRNQIIWNKTIASMGWGDYKWKHEPIFYATFENSKHQFYGDRSQYTVLDEKWDIEKIIKNIKKIGEKMDKGGSTIWKMSRDSGYEHPTQKPIELIETAIYNSSKAEDVVLDLFGGSGSTLIAAEKTGRHCFMMELDPKYVQVIIDRWRRYTEKEAIIL